MPEAGTAPIMLAEKEPAHPLLVFVIGFVAGWALAPWLNRQLFTLRTEASERFTRSGREYRAWAKKQQRRRGR